MGKESSIVLSFVGGVRSIVSVRQVVGGVLIFSQAGGGMSIDFRFVVVGGVLFESCGVVEGVLFFSLACGGRSIFLLCIRS